MLKKETLDPSHNTVSYLFVCISILKKEGNPLPIPQHSKLFIYLYLHVEGKIAIPQHSKLFIYLYLYVEEGNPLPIPQHSKLFIYLYLYVEEGNSLPIAQHNKLFIYLSTTL